MRDRFTHALDVIDDMRGAATLPDLAATFHDAVKAFGFDNYTCLSLTDFSRIDMNRYFRKDEVDYSAVPKDVALFLQYFPREWADHYWTQNYGLIDPILRYGLDKHAPFEWRDATRDLTRAQMQFFDEASTYDVADGITVPINQRGQLPVTINLIGSDFDRSRETQSALYLISLYFQAQAHKMHAAPFTPAGRGLTERQREVLMWTACGKSSDEIGEILNISTSTVIHHIEAAKRHYGVNTRVQAVVKAVHFGEIVP